jgi:hypothetical protein
MLPPVNVTSREFWPGLVRGSCVQTGTMVVTGEAMGQQRRAWQGRLDSVAHELRLLVVHMSRLGVGDASPDGKDTDLMMTVVVALLVPMALLLPIYGGDAAIDMTMNR